jgi:hypothetical protein
MHEAPLVLVVLRLLHPMLPQATTLRVLPQVRSKMSSLKHLPRAPDPMDLGLPMGINLGMARPCLSPRNSHDSIH